VDWAEIAQRRMFPNTIVECLDVLKNGGSCLLMGFEMDARSTFAFERAKEALHDGIIPTIAFAAHADLNPMLLEKALIGFAGRLTPTVGVMQ